MNPKIRVMIVEDEQALAITLAEAIRRASKGAYDVLVCNTPQEALVHLSATVFDLVISDLRLPGMSGLELIERIRQRTPGTHTILMTGYGSQDTEAKAQQITDAYLKKPFHLPEVLKLIQRILAPDEQKQSMDALIVENSLPAPRKIMDELRFETKAPYAMLLDLYGHTMIDSGSPGAIDKTILNALLISSMAASQELAQAFHEKRAFDMHYYDGERYEIYLRKVNAEIVIALLIDLQQTKTPIGGIRLHLRRAVEAIREISDQLLATERGSGNENLETILPQGSSELSDSIDDLLFGDEKPTGTSAPKADKESNEKATNKYISLDDAIQQGIIKIDPYQDK